MKKFLALLLTLVMALSLAACGGSDEESTDSPAEDPAANEESSGSAADVKIGLICVHDINSGYDAAHIEGLSAPRAPRRPWTPLGPASRTAA